eukprot:CAMPEP_0114581802 /NCGR_PEP_ID=MMETSP0125-20121206/5874_1 /TAXON_ID=485358 ORGANISM="Aristerostoma sp., Strain ATCC 50986" /NCGR_SAMPLE_ID=MMETSP0125 /ASSEMBLY_ACC=CAM_ASM_000245 /LENGTH=306 /DNA_ID=CAMNT_0001774301 /DNA_START=228 /DNA_END=1148 /DNA_ORIENTATION=-
MARQKDRPKAFGRTLGHHTQVMLIDPEAVKEYFNHPARYIKHPEVLGPFFDLSKNGLVMMDGKLWRVHRKLIAQGFQFDHLKSMVPDMIEHCQREVAAIQSRATNMSRVSIFDEIKIIAGNVIGATFFGVRMGDYRIDGISPALYLTNILSDASCIPYTDSYAIGGNSLVKLKLFSDHKKLTEDITKFRNWCKGMIAEGMNERKRQHEAGEFEKKTIGYNMFDIFYQYNLENPTEPLTEDELIDEFITFFSDGVYTTGHFMTMFLHNLLLHPEWKVKVMAEMDEMFPKLEDVTYEKLQSMDTFTMV